MKLKEIDNIIAPCEAIKENECHLMIEFSSEVEASHKHFDEFFEEWGQPFDQRIAC
jgi:hypothetical protein